MSFEVINPGLMTLLQDKGRCGWQHVGVTTGGPMDEYAFLWANYLLGNSEEAAQLEITFGNLVLQSETETSIAITGADLDARINDRPVQPWHTYKIRIGDRLAFNQPVSGMRAYLAVSGGFKGKAKLGSLSTVTREKMGGIHGTGDKLKKGDRLGCALVKRYVESHVPDWAVPDYRQATHLGVMLGYQHRRFPQSEINKFFSSDYEVTQQIDRMGYRLSGTAIKSDLSGIVSEGIALGAIQIPKDGQPIVLMKDRQTIGGYPKIGCLSALEIGKLAQQPPGAKITFYPMDVSEAEAQRVLLNRKFSL